MLEVIEENYVRKLASDVINIATKTEECAIACERFKNLKMIKIQNLNFSRIKHQFIYSKLLLMLSD